MKQAHSRFCIATYSSTVVFLSSFAITAYSDDAIPSHCTSDETVYFSCSTGKKLISYCGSKRISATEGYLQYKFGSPGKLEITLPPKKDLAARSFTFSSDTTARADTTYSISVKNGDITYNLDSMVEMRNGQEHGTLNVVKTGKGQIAELNCKTVYANRLSDLEAASIPNADQSNIASQPQPTQASQSQQPQQKTQTMQAPNRTGGNQAVESAASKNAAKIAALGFSKVELQSMIYTKNDLINPYQKFLTLEGLLGLLFELPKVSKITAIESGKSKGVLLKASGAPSSGFLFKFDGGDAFLTHVVNGDEATRLQNDNEIYTASLFLMQVAAAAIKP